MNEIVVDVVKVLEFKEYYMDKKVCPLEHTEHARHCSLLDSQKKENSVCQYRDECKQIYESLENKLLEEVIV